MSTTTNINTSSTAVPTASLAPKPVTTYDSQFSMTSRDYLQKIDFLNWYRYFHLFKDLLKLAPKSVLEVGAGEGTLKRITSPVIPEHKVLDINTRLNPDYLGDVRVALPELKERFDCAIAADVLEHIPFGDLGTAVKNLASYCRDGGHLLITIPHRRSHFLWMTPNQIPHVFTVPTGFLSLGGFYRRFIKRKIWIDPHHCWEIGDGHVTRKDVNAVFEREGLKIVSLTKLLYVDYWVLQKQC